jgi:hypothetical protein
MVQGERQPASGRGQDLAEGLLGEEGGLRAPPGRRRVQDRIARIARVSNPANQNNEATAEKLSEIEGIGLKKAEKLIEAAKAHLDQAGEKKGEKGPLKSS